MTWNLQMKMYFYVYLFRIRRANPGLSNDQLNKENSKRDDDAFKEASYETSYHELGEINKSETYASCQ